MILKDILKGEKYSVLGGSDSADITSVEYDSRNVKKGSLFVCISGFKTDGHKYIRPLKAARRPCVLKKTLKFRRVFPA